MLSSVKDKKSEHNKTYPQFGVGCCGVLLTSLINDGYESNFLITNVKKFISTSITPKTDWVSSVIFAAWCEANAIDLMLNKNVWTWNIVFNFFLYFLPFMKGSLILLAQLHAIFLMIVCNHLISKGCISKNLIEIACEGC